MAGRIKREDMQYKIRYIGDPVLRKPTTDVGTFDDTFRRFIKDMTDVMYVEDGIGLAAPQIGFSKSVVIVDVSELVKGEGLRIFVNPKIYSTSGESVVEEGCLSIPGVREKVTRPDTIRMTYQDETGAEFDEEFDGWPARVLQHEVDHLNGILFVDHISPLKRQLLISKEMIPAKY